MKNALKLDELQIDGFGHFHEFKISLGPGLNVLYGDNEVGKSTLLAFVRSVLFGFARRNTPERYEPIGGRAFGGRVLLSTPHGELWVQRLGGKRQEGELSVKNGVMAPVAESKLREALASIDKALFEQVFAFGLDQLRSWTDLLEAGSVNEALAAASMQGALRLPHALERFERDAAALWGPRAPTRALNLALQALSEVRSRRQLLGDRPGEYFAARAALEATAAEEARLAAQLEAAAAEEFTLERLREAAPHIERAVQAAVELAALAPVERFPADGLARIEEALVGQSSARASHARAASAAQTLERRLAQLRATLGARAPAAPVAAAVEGWRAVATLDAELSGRQADWELRRRRLDEQVQRLGLAGPLEGLDASASARASLGGLRSRLAEVGERRARAEETLAQASARADEAQRELATREAERDSLGGEGAASLEQALEAARALPNVEHQAHLVEAQLEDRQTALAAAAVPDEPAPVERWPLGLVATLGLGLLALAGASFALAGSGAGVAALGFAIAFDALLIGLHRKDHAHWLSQKSAHQAVLRHRHEHRARLTAEVQIARARWSSLRQQLDQLRTTAGVPPDTAGGARLAELERLAALAGRRAELVRDLALGRSRQQSAKDDRGRALAALGRAQTDWEAARAALDGLLEKIGLPRGLDGSGALELLAEVGLAQGAARSLADQSAALGRDADRVALAAQALEHAAAVAQVTGATAGELLERLNAWLKHAASLEADAATVGSRLEDAAAALGTAKADEAQAQARVEALLAAAGATEVEQFRHQGTAFETATRISGDARQAAARVKAVCRLEVEAAHAQLLLPPGLEARREAARERRLALEDQRGAVHEQRGSLGQQLSAWESEAELGRLLHEEQALAARATELARRVAVARLGQAVLGQAREKFEAEHQPQLVLRAGETFKLLTDGRYPKLALDAANRALHAIDSQGRSFSPEQLSRGTREQLLTSLRLAMIENFGRERLALPVLVDDVLVNFDPHRAERMVAALAELARRHQVLAFTCHPQFRELFKAHGAKAIEVSTRAQLALLPS